MNHLPTGCPSRRIDLELPLATIEELDDLAARQHLDRDQILHQIIDAALIRDTPPWPAGPAALDRLAAQVTLTRIRSHELAASDNARPAPQAHAAGHESAVRRTSK